MTIKDYRLAYGIKQVDMAKIIGVTLTTYQRKEYGQYDFTLKEMRTMYNHFLKYNSKLNAGKFFLEA